MTTANRNRRDVRRSLFPLHLVLAIVTVAALGTAVSAGESSDEDAAAAGASTLDGVYTEAQVERIESTYQRDCAACHGAELGGSGMAPPLTGLPFMFFWESKTLAELYTFTHDNMPLGNPGSLSDQAYADLVAKILAANGFPAGEAELLPDLDALAQITIAPAPSAGGE